MEPTNVTSFLCIFPERKYIHKKLTLILKITLSLLHRLSGSEKEQCLIIVPGLDFKGWGEHIYLQGRIYFLGSFNEEEIDLNVFLSYFRSKQAIFVRTPLTGKTGQRKMSSSPIQSLTPPCFVFPKRNFIIIALHVLLEYGEEEESPFVLLPRPKLTSSPEESQDTTPHPPLPRYSCGPSQLTKNN